MKRQTLFALSLMMFAAILNFSCEKGQACVDRVDADKEPSDLVAKKLHSPDFDLNVNLKGWDNGQGHLKFRQDPDALKIIELNIKVHNLLPNHEYLLQRAVDPINMVDGDCSSTSWLTLGDGLTPQSIMTNAQGNGEEDLWRDVTAVPSDASFDIHFQVVDAVTLEVVLSSDCYQYKVR